MEEIPTQFMSFNSINYLRTGMQIEDGLMMVQISNPRKITGSWHYKYATVDEQ